REKLNSPGENYPRLEASLKALEGPAETDASRRKPYPAVSTGRRTALARWIASRDNPLTARVAVNHIWMRHFGQPLVDPVNDFGRRTAAPPQQELLDWLAVEFMEHGWSMKHLHRLIVTSQEKLTELVGGLDDRRVELARLMDRFPLQVHLEPSDISEVTSRRILSKNAAGEETLRKLFDTHRGKLSQCTAISADIRLPELSAENFISLYPLLPYQIDLIINIVSGLRTQGGASHHVGGANRTIIKLAQQLLIHPDVALAEAPSGTLARIDQIFDLVSGNIASELRGKISDIGRQVDHPMAAQVAKAICLLQFVKSIHRTAENIAACLHPSIDGDPCLAEVKLALEKLVAAKSVRLGDDGYRIPSPAEDDWERQRDLFNPKPADTNEILRDVVLKLWSPQPQHQLLDTKLFKASLFLNNRPVVQDGDIPFHLALASTDADFQSETAEMRTRSQTETKSIFWSARLPDKVDHHLTEVFRSKQIIAAKERGARTRDELSLVADEKKRLTRHSDELRRLVRETMLAGTVWFRGNDRSPGDQIADVGRAAEATLGIALPEVFDRYADGAAKVTKGDLDSILSAANLHGLTPIYQKLNLLRDEGNQTVLRCESGPLAEILSRIQNRASYGELASGRYLTEEFAKEPYGWDLDVVRLFVACLLRAGLIEATSQGKTIESALSTESKALFGNNNTYRSATFRPKVAIDFEKLIEANEAFKDVFGRELADIASQGAVAEEIRAACAPPEEDLSTTHRLLLGNQLPGASVIEEALNLLKSIRTGTEEQAILAFNGGHKQLKEAR
ncbi:MAG: BREX system P-loop protein BrxC, partial [Verrucomicrobiae bacterium]|nr:BREX system P-loop protein BrxC [Verrucomicrobiae bacterium]